MDVLVTRPLEDAEETAAELRARGHEPVIAPLMEIRFCAGPALALDDVQAILATSANGVRALALRTPRRDVPVFAVGPQTADRARAAGFRNVKSADGDAAALARAVIGWARPAGGALFHASGAQTKGDLAARLTAAGFHVRCETLYEAAAVEALPAAAAEMLASDRPKAVLLYSPRSARIFADCVVRAGLAEACRNLAALCISQAAADALAPLQFQAVRIAAHPDQDGLFALIN